MQMWINLLVHTSIYIDIHIYIEICTREYLQMRTKNVCMYVCMYACIYMYIYICMCMFIYFFCLICLSICIIWLRPHGPPLSHPWYLPPPCGVEEVVLNQEL